MSCAVIRFEHVEPHPLSAKPGPNKLAYNVHGNRTMPLARLDNDDPAKLDAVTIGFQHQNHEADELIASPD
jgi:hypothetical protein